MKATITEDCKVAPKGFETISLTKGQQVEGELAQFCVAKKLAKTANKPAVKKKAPAKKATKAAKSKK